MRANGLPDGLDELLATLEQLPVDALQIVQWLVDELVERPDDNEHRKQILSAATARLSALRSV